MGRLKLATVRARSVGNRRRVRARTPVFMTGARSNLIDRFGMLDRMSVVIALDVRAKKEAPTAGNSGGRCVVDPELSTQMTADLTPSQG